MSNKELAIGGEFLLKKTDPENVFTPEDFNDEHLMVKKTVEDFGENEVLTRTEEIQDRVEGVAVELMRKAGELGLLANDIPEEYDGDGGDKITTAIITEAMTYSGSFSTTFGAHTGIGTLPIIFFGTHEQKEKYLPGLASGEKIAAYCLTEPEAGSDALNAKTVAMPSDCGKFYILNGSKTFITNAAWADVFIVYAKVDGDKFTAFIIEKGTEGLSIGAEEKKMGIKGSSTCDVIMADCKVPVENVLGEIGKGHKIAFNILNIGRFKLAAGVLGASKKAIMASVDYAQQRIQFKQPIADFTLIKNKIADMVIKTYAEESLVYRTVGMIDERLNSLEDKNDFAGLAAAIQEYAMECSINKVYCSERFDEIADEAVQIFGGYGYISEYIVEAMYRDSRINRIFEGTNEVNRMLVPGTLLPKAMKGELPFMDAVFGLKDELDKLKEMEVPAAPIEREEFIIEAMKKLHVACAGNAARKYEQALTKEQEVLCGLADLAMEIYACESALLRTKKVIARDGEEAAKFHIMITQCLVADMVPKMQGWAQEIMAAIFEPEKAVKRFEEIALMCRTLPLNTFALKREIADEAYAAKGYFLEKK